MNHKETCNGGFRVAHNEGFFPPISFTLQNQHYITGAHRLKNRSVQFYLGAE